MKDKIIENRQLFFDARKLFYKTFNTHTNFFDFNLTVLSGRPRLDIQKFDNYLHILHGNYEDEGFSMCDVLTINYGKSVAMQIKDMI